MWKQFKRLPASSAPPPVKFEAMRADAFRFAARPAAEAAQEAQEEEEAQEEVAAAAAAAAADAPRPRQKFTVNLDPTFDGANVIGALSACHGAEPILPPAQVRPRPAPAAAPAAAAPAAPKKRPRIIADAAAEEEEEEEAAAPKKISRPSSSSSSSSVATTAAAQHIELLLRQQQQRRRQQPPSLVNPKIATNPLQLANRATFAKFTERLLQPYKQGVDDMLSESGGVDCASLRAVNDADQVELLQNQRVVRDYLSLSTPYEGAVLVHGLGTGKTGSAVAVAEALCTEKRIFVLQPASLANNFWNELAKFGDPLFSLNQHWVNVSAAELAAVPAAPKAIAAALHLLPARGAVWLCDPAKPANYAELGKDEQAQVREQARRMMAGKYTDVHYNAGAALSNVLNQLAAAANPDASPEQCRAVGVTGSGKAAAAAAGLRNPFDDSVVIVDEAHNFVSRILGARGASNRRTNVFSRLYHLLQGARGARLVFLTATPMTNRPHELGPMFNMLRRYIRTWKFQMEPGSAAAPDTASVQKWLAEEAGAVHDFVEVGSNNRLTVTRNPFGFVNVYAKPPAAAASGGKTHRRHRRHRDPKKKKKKKQEQEGEREGGTRRRRRRKKKRTAAAGGQCGSSACTPAGETVKRAVDFITGGAAAAGGAVSGGGGGQCGSSACTPAGETVKRAVDFITGAVSGGAAASGGEEASGGAALGTGKYLGVRRDAGAGRMTDEAFVARIVRVMAAHGVRLRATTKTGKMATPDELTLLPDDPMVFDSTFVNPDAVELEIERTEQGATSAAAPASASASATEVLVKADVFKSRILGLTSYFRSAQEKLMPRVEPDPATGGDVHYVSVPMSDEQFQRYGVLRSEEIDKEKSARKSKTSKNAAAADGDDPGGKKKGDADGGSSYRSASRVACNTVLPPDVAKAAKAAVAADGQNYGSAGVGDDDDEYDDDDDAASDVDGGADEAADEADEDEAADEAAALKKKKAAAASAAVVAKLHAKQRKLYAAALLRAQLEQMELHGYYESAGAARFMPKLPAMLANIRRRPDAHQLIYANYRRRGGIEEVTRFLDAHGYARLRIERRKGKWRLSEDHDRSKKHYVLYTGEENQDEREVARNVYNGVWKNLGSELQADLRAVDPTGLDNVDAAVVQLILITSAGAEGITLLRTRAVHALEPYWHMARFRQVFGRGRRICSHWDMPEEEQTIAAYMYVSTFTEAQRDSPAFTTMSTTDRNRKGVMVTTDEHLLESALLKEVVNEHFLAAMRATAFDCSLYGADACYSAPKRGDDFIMHPRIETDLDIVDAPQANFPPPRAPAPPAPPPPAPAAPMNNDNNALLPAVPVVAAAAKLRIAVLRGEKYALDESTDIVYDHAAYLENRRVRLGKYLRDERKFVFDDPARNKKKRARDDDAATDAAPDAEAPAPDAEAPAKKKNKKNKAADDAAPDDAVAPDALLNREMASLKRAAARDTLANRLNVDSRATMPGDATSEKTRLPFTCSPFVAVVLNADKIKDTNFPIVTNHRLLNRQVLPGMYGGGGGAPAQQQQQQHRPRFNADKWTAPVYTNGPSDAAALHRTAAYIYDEMKTATLVRIANNRVAAFLPIYNVGHRSSEVFPGVGDAAAFIASRRAFDRNAAAAAYEPDPRKWGFTDCLVSTAVEGLRPNTGYLSQFYDMLATTCARHTVGDCVFVLNRKDFPFLDREGNEAFHNIHGPGKPRAAARPGDAFLGWCSASTTDLHADLPLPTADDWDSIRSDTFFADWMGRPQRFECTNARADSEALRAAAAVPWRERKNAVVWRGQNTGCGSTAQNNPRVALALADLPGLEAGITKFTRRDKINPDTRQIELPSHPEQLKVTSELRGPAQLAYRFVVNVEGNSAAYRYGALFAGGQVILNVLSKYKLWFEPLLRPFRVGGPDGDPDAGECTHIEVRHDLADLPAAVAWCLANADACERIAARARAFYDAHFTLDFATEYVADTLNGFAARMAPDGPAAAPAAAAAPAPAAASKVSAAPLSYEQLHKLRSDEIKAAKAVVKAVELRADSDLQQEAQQLLRGQAQWPRGKVDDSFVIVVPYRANARQGRADHLARFLAHYGPSCNILVVEQADDGRKFNRGALLNAGFLFLSGEIAAGDRAPRSFGPRVNKVVFHDVDVEMPLAVVHSMYGAPNFKARDTDVVHFGALVENHYARGNPNFLGAVLAVSPRAFAHINGFPNHFYGWGGEDDAMVYRLHRSNYTVARPSSLGPELLAKEWPLATEKSDGRFDKAAQDTHKLEDLQLDLATATVNGLNSLQYRTLGIRRLPGAAAAHMLTVSF